MVMSIKLVMIFPWLLLVGGILLVLALLNGK